MVPRDSSANRGLANCGKRLSWKSHSSRSFSQNSCTISDEAPPGPAFTPETGDLARSYGSDGRFNSSEGDSEANVGLAGGLSECANSYLPRSVAACCSRPETAANRQVLSTVGPERMPASARSSSPAGGTPHLKSEAVSSHFRAGQSPERSSWEGHDRSPVLPTLHRSVSAVGRREGKTKLKGPPKLVLLEDLQYLPPVLPDLRRPERRWWQSLFRPSFSLPGCCKMNDEFGMEETGTSQKLRSLTRGLDFLFLLIAVAVVLSPVMEVFEKPVVLGPEKMPGSRRLFAGSVDSHAVHEHGSPILGEGLEHLGAVETSLEWTRWHVQWPPFFEPNAFVLDELDGDTLHVASGSVVRSLRCSWASDQSGTSSLERRCAAQGPAIVLPEGSRGLGFIHSSLVAVGDKGIYALQRPFQSGSSPGSSHDDELEEQGLLGMLAAASASPSPVLPAVQTPAHPRLIAPHNAGRLVVAAVADLPAAGVNATGVVLASADAEGGVTFAALPASALTPNSLTEGVSEADGEPARILAQLRIAGEPLRNVSGLHVSTGCAGEPVIWVAISSPRGSRILALGLTTGRLLAASRMLFDLTPRPPIASTSAGLLRGKSQSATLETRERGMAAGQLNIVALAGNATHLFALATRQGEGANIGGEGPVMLSARLPSLAVLAPQHRPEA